MEARGAGSDDHHGRVFGLGGGQERSTVPRGPAPRQPLTLYFRHPASFEHETGQHPENAGRVRAIESALERTGWAGLDVREAPAAELEWLERVHSPEHVARVEALCGVGGGMVDLDTVASAGTWNAARRASGAACEAAERLLAGEDATAFCALRPPGHHAERDRAMGFCFFNHVAAAAAHALAVGSAERVLILDWDVHHGNGTEAIFRESNSVLYASIHQSPLYPGTGDASYTGEGAGEGYTVNLPVAAGAGSPEFLALVQHVVVPLARRFEPGLIVISAGFDAHRADPLASCEVDEDGYRALAGAMRAVAAELDAPILACLEGGYDPDALAASVVATIEGLGSAGSPEEADPVLAAAHLERLAGAWGLGSSA